MKGSISHDSEIGVSVDEIWAVYRTLEFVDLIVKLLPHIVQKVELIEGHGEVGSILHVCFVPGATSVPSFKEKMTKVDDENHVREALVVEGGYLEFGFLSYMVRLEITGKSETTSIIRSTIEYEVDEKLAANSSLVNMDVYALMNETVGKHLVERKSDYV